MAPDSKSGYLPGRQRNHDAFYLPENIRYLGPLPLYLAVAWWGLLNARPFDRQDIARAFRIDVRRASGIMGYLCHRIRPGVVRLEHMVSRDSKGHRKMSVLVTEVMSPAPLMTCVSDTKPDADLARKLSRWLLSRPTGHDEKQHRQWRAACPVQIEEI